MLKILVVCTGNVCRSPLAQHVLAQSLTDLPVSVDSAGTRARADMRMPRPAVELGVSLGVPVSLTMAHKARTLGPSQLTAADLILALAREHRRAIVEVEPSATRRTFTLREFDRLASRLPDGILLAAAGAIPQASARERLAKLLDLLASQRGLLVPPPGGWNDDVIDPYGRPPEVYEQSAREMSAGIIAVSRVINLVWGPREDENVIA